MLEPSSFRRSPPCPVAERCGGCSLQHIDYGKQAQEKANILRAAFKKLAARQEAMGRPIEFRPFLRAEHEFFYRNRVQVHSYQNQIGYFAKNSRNLVPVNRCWIADPLINEKLSEIRDRFQSAKTPVRVEIACDPKNPGSVLLAEGKALARDAMFSQVNTEQNIKLIELVKKLAQRFQVETLYDLYCGSGNFTVPLAENLKLSEVVGVDLSQGNINRARETSREHNIQWKVSDVGRYLQGLSQVSNSVFVLDPPRDGCDKTVIQEIARLRPMGLIYISCNPMTLVRDLTSLVTMGRYSVESVQGIDMFPQTAHIESVAVVRAIDL